MLRLRDEHGPIFYLALRVARTAKWRFQGGSRVGLNSSCGKTEARFGISVKNYVDSHSTV